MTTLPRGGGTLDHNTSGNDNTAIGRGALNGITTGNRNTALGLVAGAAQTTGSDNIYVDNNGVAGESNTIRIGDVHTRTFIAGIDGVTVGGVGTTVFVDGNGQLGTIVSSRRFKEQISDMGEASSGLLRLRPVTFRYNKEHTNGTRRLQYGLIAEEVAEVDPELVVYSSTGEAKTVQYHKVNAMLLNEEQKQHRQIEDLTERLNRLEAMVEEARALASLEK